MKNWGDLICTLKMWRMFFHIVLGGISGSQAHAMFIRVGRMEWVLKYMSSFDTSRPTDDATSYHENL